MGLKQRCIRMAMLNADTSIPNVYADMGTFGDILHRVLAEAASRMQDYLMIQHSVFDVVKGEYPTSLENFDVILITASAASSYHLEPWIQELERYIVSVYRDNARVKIFGSCFGHHIICQALLKDNGLRVERSPKGWEIGVSPVALTEGFRSAYAASIQRKPTNSYRRYAGRLPSPDDEDTDVDCTPMPKDLTGSAIPQTVRLQFVHEDQVILPYGKENLSEPWVLLGSTDHCAVQGIFQPGRVLTLQGHFEFDKFESRQTQRIFGADTSSTQERSNSNDSFGGALRDEMDDGYLVAEMVVLFLSGRGGEKDMAVIEQQETLPTPRASLELCERLPHLHHDNLGG